MRAEYDRQLEARLREAARTAPDAVFPALGVQVRDGVVEAYSTGMVELGPLPGAEARVTDGSQAWSPGRAMFLPIRNQAAPNRGVASYRQN